MWGTNAVGGGKQLGRRLLLYDHRLGSLLNWSLHLYFMGFKVQPLEGFLGQACIQAGNLP